ncbi:hypothetical protein, partial [Catenuloplanes japonicus]|uniref:hypothetical protein n=1 Tax=Catenuloplanes japonicus TaxID=33876 RepID=UPI001E65234D
NGHTRNFPAHAALGKAHKLAGRSASDDRCPREHADRNHAGSGKMPWNLILPWRPCTVATVTSGDLGIVQG